MKSLTLCLLLFAVAATNLHAGIKAEVLYDKQADFSIYKTYRWVTGPVDDSPEGQLIDKKIKLAADAELGKKGLQKVAEGEPADLLITYYGGLDSSLLMEGVRYELAPHVVWTGADPMGVTNRYEAGTLVLDFADSSTEKIVWSGVAQAKAPTPAQLRAKVEKAVKKVLKQYPPK